MKMQKHHEMPDVSIQANKDLEVEWSTFDRDGLSGGSLHLGPNLNLYGQTSDLIRVLSEGLQQILLKQSQGGKK